METPKPEIAARALMRSLDHYRELYAESINDPLGFWGKVARRLDWFSPPLSTGRWDFNTVDFAWYEGGKLNAAWNCLDRHLPLRGDKDAIIWAKDEPGQYEPITYKQLHHEVGRVANVLKHHGVRKGDRVCIYLPM